MNLNRHALRILTIVVPVFLIGYALELLSPSSSALGDYFEISTELLPFVLSFSIFVITWVTYEKSGDNHSLFLGTAFFVIGLLDMYHILSYPFMPDFITSNSQQKSTIFQVLAMLFSSVLFLVSTAVYEKTLPRLINKSILFGAVNALSFTSLTAVLLYQERLPLLYDDSGSSANLKSLVIIAVVLLLCASYLYMKRFRESRQESIICLIYSFSILIFSDLVYIYYDYAGHLLKAAGFYFVYMALFKSSVVKPFEKMAEGEKKLRQSAEERYRNLVDNASDAIISTDLDGRVASWNRSAENTYGWSVEEVLGKKLSQLIVPPDMQVEYELLIHSIMLGGKISGIETMHQRRDGIKIDVSLTISPLHNMNNKIIGLSCIIRDITEHKHAEEIQHDNMRLALGIKAKSEFLTGLSHDLGTPLNAIMGFSELLKQGIAGQLNRKQEQYIDNILTSSQRMLDIVNDVLDLGRAETGKIDMAIGDIPVSAVIDETASLLKENMTRRNVVLKKEFDPELEFIEADRQRFKQIMYNLLSNAVKYSKPEGGTVTITTKQEGEMAKFSISDTGIGIRKEDMGKLFRAFEQLYLAPASKYGSTGLGLVVTKKLVELHGGKITVESRFGEGSTFTFYLPMKSKKQE